jgi:hypothetical protein
MTTNQVWIVIEYINPNEIPITSFFESVSTGFDFENTNNLPKLHGHYKSSQVERPIFIQPNKIHKRSPLTNIKLVGVYSNHTSACSVVGNATNRKILGPSTIQQY